MWYTSKNIPINIPVSRSIQATSPPFSLFSIVRLITRAIDRFFHHTDAILILFTACLLFLFTTILSISETLGQK